MNKSTKTLDRDRRQSHPSDTEIEFKLSDSINLEESQLEDPEKTLKKILDLISDELSLKILFAAKKNGMTIKELRKKFHVPALTCRKKTEELTNLSLLEPSIREASKKETKSPGIRVF